MMTQGAMMDYLTDYANEFGDQKTLELMEVWKFRKMGIHDKTPAIDVLVSIQHQVSQLSNDKKPIEYLSALTDVMIIILQTIAKL